MSKQEKIASMDTLVSFAKQKGFIFSGSELYGGLAGTYDYGPLGVSLKENIKSLWRKSMTYDHDNIVELDSAIFMHSDTWKASGHVDGFSDPLTECRNCNTRLRVDKVLEDVGEIADEKMSEEEIDVLFQKNIDKIKCPTCGKRDFTPAKKFNLLVRSNLGDFTQEISDPVYLRPETAQGIYVDYKLVQQSMRLKVPFGIAQIGKAFRNEIKPRRFVFRLREFTQMEMQYFIYPDATKDAFENWKQVRMDFYTKVLKINPEKLRFKQHENLVFYASDAWDIEYLFDFGWSEIEGIHARSDYDLTQHQNASGKDLSYTDPYTNEKYIPHIIETSCGLDRQVFTVLADAYTIESLSNEETRVVLKLPYSLAPIKIAVSPLLKNKTQLVDGARAVFAELKKEFGAVSFDDNGNIGKRYRRQDEIGTPFCVVFDFDSLDDGSVTVRERDTMNQVRVPIKDLSNWLNKNKKA